MKSNSAKDKILGNWKAEGLKNSIIRFYKTKGGDIFAKISDSDKKDWVDKVIIKALVYVEEKESWRGRFIVPGMKADLSLNIKPRSEHELKLDLSKYFLRKSIDLHK